jgi:hypothetical protein
MEENTNKNIIINGTNNRYLVKLANREKKEPKKRTAISKYKISIDNLDFNKQKDLLIAINKKKDEQDRESNNENEFIIKELQKKISSYRQQDILKKILNENEFITYDLIINKLLECEMKCHYCKNEMFIIYEFVRELSQWTVDRIDNSKGHNKDNIVLSCLNCNLKKRRTSDDKFLFTKQLNLIKKP